MAKCCIAKVSWARPIQRHDVVSEAQTRPHNKALPQARLSCGGFSWRSDRAAELGRYAAKWSLATFGRVS